MPLSTPVTREHIHTRGIDLRGYVRQDGLYDIEARLVDTKTYSFHNEFKGEMTPGMPVHEMVMRLTVDDNFLIHAVEAVTENSPYPVCPEITPNFKRLEGQRMGRGWNKTVRGLLGGVQGCTHLVELLGPMATVAFQTIRPYQRWKIKRQLEPGQEDSTTQRPFMLDSCHAWGSTSPVVKRWMPKFYTGPDAGEK